MSIKEFEQLRTNAGAVGIFTVSDLVKFYEHEKQDGEDIGATVARYAAEIINE